MVTEIAIHAQIRNKGWRLIAAVIPYLVLLPWASARAQVLDPGGSPPSVQQIPAAPGTSQWQPDEFQRAMVLGTTMPNEVPMSVIPLESQEVSGDAPEGIEEIPPIFRKPLPITSPAKTPSTKPQ